MVFPRLPSGRSRSTESTYSIAPRATRRTGSSPVTRVPSFILYVSGTYSASGKCVPRYCSDLPGFGFTEVPADRKYVYSLDQLALTTEAFTRALKLDRYAIYVFDYGAPTGFRLAMAHPERVTAIVSRDGNAYEEGLGDAWGQIRKYWADPSRQSGRA